jgi:hypothetical protein
LFVNFNFSVEYTFMKSKFKFKSSFYLVAALALVGFGAQAMAGSTQDSTSQRGVYRANGGAIQLPAASGSQCGWVGVYDRALRNRVPCEGNTLGYGNVPVCVAPAVASVYAVGQCDVQEEQCFAGEAGDICGWVTVHVPPSGSYFGPVSDVFAVTDWHCPAGFTPTQLISGGGSSGQDSFFTCVKN